MIKIINDNCFNVFPTLEKDSIDLVVVDLPYGQTACKWDSIINLDDMWEALKKICVKKCMYVFFCTTKFGVSLINSKPKWFRYDLVWEKSRKVGFLSANKMPLRKHEMIYVFGDTGVGPKTYNPQKTEGKPYIHKGRKSAKMYGDPLKKETINKGDRHPSTIVKIRGGKYDDSPYGDFKNTKSKDDGTRHPSTVLEFKNPNKPIHRTQKPVELYEWLIKSYSNEGDTVLDFCAGSFTCVIACLNTNRKYICIEKDNLIFELGKKRVDEHIKEKM